MKHTISILVENRFGVLARVAGLFSARGYNIDSLAVSETQDPQVSRMTVVVNAQDECILEQIKKQLNKLIDVITVNDFTKKEYIERELIFLRIGFEKKSLPKLKKLIVKNKAQILEKKSEYLIVELVDDQKKIQDFLLKLKDFKISELVRTGRIAIAS